MDTHTLYITDRAGIHMCVFHTFSQPNKALVILKANIEVSNASMQLAVLNSINAYQYATWLPEQ